MWLTFMIGNLGIIALAVEPAASLDATEFFIILMAAGAMGAITAEELRGKNRAHPPLAYLLSGLLALYTAMAFAFTNTWPDETSTLAVTLLLLGYGVGGITIYVASGPPDHG
jgi:uncharacterized membrane protein YoaK (UPF0700 family)